ncbi:uncharacterized protein F4807DRAFT_461193 [Annulohypoxylon truncatum]|uniref:uncharacterized protein n=1 Tax=Annulohypoxylon truncatum TaxID=327061 RepID=UPI002008C271|nr:uncharacterized protein F4807DRAFT_461193 [Annulohypoxylon truncatum]KAI1209073.1 hypothetical protein F4807DRAFT_461193 [Annulohypoxylon truncatum]
MEDVPPPSAANSELATVDVVGSAYQGRAQNEGQPPLPQGANPASNPAFSGQYQIYDPSPNAFSGQLEMSHAQGPARQGPYNMTAMAAALPPSGYRPNYNQGQPQQRYNTAPSSNMIQPMPQIAQFAGPPNMAQLGGQPYYVPQHPQMSSYYNAQFPSPQQQHQAPQQSNMSPRHNLNYYTNQVLMNQSQHPLSAAGYYYPPTNQYQSPHSNMQNQMNPAQYILADGSSSDIRDVSPPHVNDQINMVASSTRGETSTDSQSNVVRGPPRKPRQSGHAIWIGNLPPQTDLMSLVHHVCKEAPGLESLFLISKSNCAFANFKDEQSCVGAQQKLHDSKFQSVRLVSRLRKSTVEGVGGQTAPTGPAAATSPGGQNASVESMTSPRGKPSESATPVSDTQIESRNEASGDISPQKDKFFILKSLTVEDLELSVRTGVWATQAHNEEVLNNAFKLVDNVYLVFSANKSGEYFGYARMTSPINDDPAAAIEFAPKAQTTSNLDLPKAIPTEATDTCPRGRIIDDSARGTIFWEVERDDADSTADAEDSDDSASAKSAQEGEGGSNKAWGKPFKLEWLSTTRLPFYRTRGLRNPWNSNREVKIARDGTELEPSVGRRLIGLFNRIQSPGPIMGARPGIPIVAGYPPPPMPPPYR